jgi:hypothetical protein
MRLKNRLWSTATSVVLAVLLLGSGVGASEVPAATTLGVESLTAAGAVLTGTVNPRGSATSAWFEWGTDQQLASPARTDAVDVGAGTEAVAASAALDGLTPGVTYYYRVVAQNDAGTTHGAVDFFAPEPDDLSALVVNSAEDVEPAPAGKMTIREAIARADAGATITFDGRLDGARIDLKIVGETGSSLLGEVFTISAGAWVFQGYQERDYGASALYADKSLTIDPRACRRGSRWPGPAAMRATRGCWPCTAT